MTFWDSSALLPLIVEEPQSRACRGLRRAHPSIAVWALTRVELASAIRRLSREGLLLPRDVATALDRVGKLAARWTEVEALGLVRERAERALGAHPLTAADALQLAAALVLVNERPRGRPFITSDERLAKAAAAEGFAVLVPAASR
jgi:predicted nucleic acid-binding protein